MDKATGATPKEDESEAVAAQLDSMMNAMGLSDDAEAREEFRWLVDTKYIERSIDYLRVAEKLMRYKGSNSHHKKYACKKKEGRRSRKDRAK